MSETAQNLALIARAGTCKCAIPVKNVIETLRPLPIEPLAGLPPFLPGLAIIRGVPTPVMDLRLFLGQEAAAEPTRFVTIRIDARVIALAVDGVDGVLPVDTGAFAALPPLLRHAQVDAVDSVGVLDASLLVVLRTARILPEALLTAALSRGAA